MSSPAALFGGSAPTEGGSSVRPSAKAGDADFDATLHQAIDRVDAGPETSRSAPEEATPVAPTVREHPKAEGAEGEASEIAEALAASQPAPLDAPKGIARPGAGLEAPPEAIEGAESLITAERVLRDVRIPSVTAKSGSAAPAGDTPAGLTSTAPAAPAADTPTELTPAATKTPVEGGTPTGVAAELSPDVVTDSAPIRSEHPTPGIGAQEVPAADTAPREATTIDAPTPRSDRPAVEAPEGLREAKPLDPTRRAEPLTHAEVVPAEPNTEGVGTSVPPTDTEVDMIAEPVSKASATTVDAVDGHRPVLEHAPPANFEGAERPSLDAPVAPPTSDAASVPAASSVESVDSATPLDAPDAAVGSLEASAAIAPADVTRTNRSLDQLDPNLRTRIERVVRRMDVEHGHKVELVEGYRTAERQEHLFAQGRTRPGPVVTWTRESAHMESRAADLRVDGGYDDSVAYARLQRIAREEGLRTLGMQDRGHVELPANERSTTAFELRADRGALPSGVAPRTTSIGIAQVARVAHVAPVARVAQPGSARRIERAAPSSIDSKGPNVIPETPAPIQAPVIDVDVERVASRTASDASAPHRSLDSDGSADLGRDPRRPKEASARAEKAEPARPSVEALTSEARAAALDIISRATGGAISSARPVASSGFVEAMDRVEKVIEAQELARSAGTSRVRVKLDGTAGPIESVRVGLSGNQVTTGLDVSDPEVARILQSRAADLQEALQSRSMELGSLGIRAGGTSDSMVEALLGGRNDPTSDLLRTLLGGSSTETGREQREERFREQARQQWNDDRDGSRRPARDDWKEQGR